MADDQCWKQCWTVSPELLKTYLDQVFQAPALNFNDSAENLFSRLIQNTVDGASGLNNDQ